MAKYYYDKYSTVVEGRGPGTWEYNMGSYVGDGSDSPNTKVLKSTYDYYDSYDFNYTYERYVGSGTKTQRGAGQKPPVGKYHIRDEHTSRARVWKILPTTFTNPNGYDCHRVDVLSSKTIYGRGTFIETVVAENGTYPNDGIQGSYWYVRGSLVTPGTPTFITVPTEIEGGTTITISWGTSSNSDSYRLEKQLNGGSWSQIYSGTARSYSDTIPKGTRSVAYRVRGANGTAYSSYKTSQTITVQSFPEMGIRVNGALKASDAGWVKVNGQLREIDTIWVRINGVLKEAQ